MTAAGHTHAISHHRSPVPTPGRRHVRMRVMALVAVMATMMSMFVMAPPAGAVTAPDAPSAVTGVGFDRSAVVWFTAPASNGGSAVTGYTVTAVDSTTPANGGQTCTTTDPSAGCTIAGLTNADNYTFTVTATNAIGTSAPSTASAAITPAVVTTTQIAAGTIHTCALLSNTTAECWGANTAGQLGDNTTTNRYTPVQVLGIGGIGLLTGVTSISAGGNHTCAVVSGGADCWGVNTYGQLGNNTLTQRTTPVQVLGVGGTGFLSGVTSISAGASGHTCAVVSGGADCWGANTSGKLGDGTSGQRTTPVQVLGVGGTGTLAGVTSISANGNQTCAVVSGGADCWGSNSYGQLGAGKISGQSAPVRVLGVGGTGFLSDVTSISTGGSHACAVVSDGADCWGYNSNGQLGDNTSNPAPPSPQADKFTPVQVLDVGGSGFLSGVTSISAGNSHTCAVVSGGADCWGANTNGKLGDGTTGQRTRPVQVFGVGGTGLLPGVTSISAGSSHTCAVVSGGADCWGANTSGQLGDNTTTGRTAPVAVIAAPPTLPSVTAVASHAATVSWTASLSALTYTVTATDTTTPANGGQTCTTGSLSCTVSGLTNGDTYTFAFTAYNGFITSAASASTDGSVITGVPDAPTSLVATLGVGSVSIAFTAGANGGNAITKYQYTIGSGAWLDAPAGTTSPVVITGLVNYVTNSIKLRAYNAAGGGTESSPVSVTTKIGAPVLTTAYSASQAGNPARGIYTGFTGISPSGVTMVSYRINVYAKGTTTVVSTALVRPTDRGHFLGGLTRGVEYDIRIIGYLTLTGTPLLTRATYESTTRTVRV